MGVVVGLPSAVSASLRLDGGEELDLRVGLADKAAALEHLGFDGADDAFAPGVVVGIGPGGHALAEVGLFEKCPKSAAPILTSAVAVEDGVSCF